MTWEELGIGNYREYFSSKHWKGKNTKWITRNSGAKCSICNRKNTLLLHHVSYENLGEERLNRDVYIVCFNCHQKIHYIFWVIKVPLNQNSLLARMYYLKFLYCLFKFKLIQSGYYLYKCFKYIFII